MPVRRIVIATLFLFSAFSPSYAADLMAKTPSLALAPVANWTGFYVGGNAGAAWGRDEIASTLNAPAPFLAVDTAAVSSAASPTFNPAGFTGGLQAGYNWQYGSWVWGSEADFDYLGLKASNSGTFPFPSTLPGGAIGRPRRSFRRRHRTRPTGFSPRGSGWAGPVGAGSYTRPAALPSDTRNSARTSRWWPPLSRASRRRPRVSDGPPVPALNMRCRRNGRSRPSICTSIWARSRPRQRSRRHSQV